MADRTGLPAPDGHDRLLRHLLFLRRRDGVATADFRRFVAEVLARDSRCITTKYQGTITLAGVRGVAVADVIRRLGAASQLDAEVSALFLPEPSAVLG